MRIVFLQDHLRNGGTENQTIHLANELAKLGNETHIIVFRKGGILDPLAISSECHVHFLNQGPLKTDWFAPGLKRLIRTLNPNVVIAMGRMGNCHAGLLCRQRKRPYKIVSTFRTGKAIPSLYRKALRISDAIVANSHEALERIRKSENIHRPDSSRVIHNGCIRQFDSTNTANEHVHLISVCMFRPEKNQIALVRLCKKLPSNLDWELTLAGDGPTRQACIKEAKRLSLEHRMHFPGLLKNPRKLYARGDIAVHCSRSESLPNFLVEAQMSGIPVIAYETGGVAECFEQGKSGYLIPLDDETEFLERLEFLIESPDLRRQMSQASSDYANRRFSTEAQTRAYQDMLDELIR